MTRTDAATPKRPRARQWLGGLTAAVLSAAMVVIAGGGASFVRKPVGAAYTGLWLCWWGALILGRHRGSPSAHDRSQRVIVVLGTVLFLVLILGAPWEYAHLEGPLPRDGALAWIGLALFAVGIGVQVAAFRALGQLFTTRLGIQPVHALVTRGPYRVVRHPAYLGYLVTFTGMALSLGSLSALAVTVLIAVLLAGRIRDEEAMLEATFSGAYRAYRQQTRWRLIPWVY